MGYDQIFVRHRSPGVPGRLLARVAMGACLVAAAYYLRAYFPPTPAALAVVVPTSIALALLYLNASQRRALRTLHRGMLRAQEGELQPVRLGHVVGSLMREIAADYNLLMTNLGSLFQEIEACQSRTISDRNRNDAILHSLPCTLVCIDSDGRITHSNRQAEQFAAPRGQLIGENLFGILDLDDEGVALVRDALLYERPVVNKEVALHVGGASRQFTLNLAPFRSLNRSGFGAAVVLQDITDYKRLQESAFTIEKLTAIGQLAAGVAHELNTPLGNIMGYARLMEEKGHSRGELEDYSRVISSEAQRCSRIVENLLSYARWDLCPVETCGINQLITEVVETVASCQGRRYEVAISVELAGESPVVQGESGQIEIVVVNLLMNAIQASRESGRPAQVIVRTRVGSPAWVTMEVEDNGVGVRPELQARIFDPFFTTKEVGEGTGLGLAISQMIVARLGGHLKYDASYKSGSRFVVQMLRA